jgi:glycosyltransferase involved in cell wall biosynthesis
MRVLVVASTFPVRPDDGLPRFVYDLCQALTRRCEVIALVPDAPGAPRRERMGGVDVRRFAYFAPRRLSRLAYGHGIAANLRRSHWAKLQVAPYLAAQVRAIARIVRSERVDVVNSHWILPQGLCAALARGGKARFGHVATLHGGDAYLLARLPGRRRLARFVVQRSDALVAVSGNVRAALDAALGVESGALLQPVGVDVNRFAGEETAPPELPFRDGFVLFVGRLVGIKGVAFLLHALPTLRERHPGLGLVVVGGGPDEAALCEEATRIGIGDAVAFVGRRPHAEVARYLRAARAVAVPSLTGRAGRAEGMPAVVLEAMAAGVPLVATATGGIPDLVRDGENGWLCRERDADDLAAKLLLALDADRRSLAARALETAQRHDWSRVAERYFTLFEKACARPRAGSPRGGA